MNNYYDPIEYVVKPEEDGFLLKTILQKRLQVSRKLMSRLKLTEQGITLNGERVYISVKVKAGDVVAIRMEKETSDDILPQPIPFDILYEDDALLIINKQAGIIVHPTHGHYTDTLANGVVYYWQQRGEQYRFRPVHRLDQETSGVLAVAKNPYVHQHISEQLIAGLVNKKYLALVHGSPVPPKGSVDGPIDRDPLEPHRRIVTPTGYSALTHYEVLEHYKYGSLVQLILESGRTHQIRVHMTHIGCPLIGDKMYQLTNKAELPEELAKKMDELDQSIERQALHAAELAFTHPISGEYMTFQAPLPSDMIQLKERLQKEDNKSE
ncbi:RluA family pseudouridine synthase [Paenibacillus sediminis]|uniref:Pseudouridine synthase n=1 Tax=Paenibacillus sediminis TaxID=664909 RepID=A0ABS4H4R7_9BACL|nr:RluA family pseudouridine synthase [Paenibacillus sediminis]MBP1937530.1 23S rRNA pseudouridine1911/1915/1917 synthase [Paenibacillus sediminis]